MSYFLENASYGVGMLVGGVLMFGAWNDWPNLVMAAIVLVGAWLHKLALCGAQRAGQRYCI